MYVVCTLTRQGRASTLRSIRRTVVAFGPIVSAHLSPRLAETAYASKGGRYNHPPIRS